MRGFKLKLLTLGVVSTLVLSSTSVFAATNNSIKINTQKPIENKVCIAHTGMCCKGDGVRVRAQPNTNSTILGLMYYGESIFINVDDCPSQNGFLKIWHNGNFGWISEDYIGYVR